MENTTQTTLSQFETDPAIEVQHTVREYGETKASDYVAHWSNLHACDEDGRTACGRTAKTYLGRNSLPWNAGFGGSASNFGKVQDIDTAGFLALGYKTCASCRNALGVVIE
jgi:hypothetical protein